MRISPTVVCVSASAAKSNCDPADLFDVLTLKISPVTVSKLIIRTFAKDKLCVVLVVIL